MEIRPTQEADQSPPMERRIQIGLNVLEPALRYALSDEAFQRDFFSAFRFGISMRVEELLKQAGVAASFHKPLPTYFRPKTPLVSLDPINIQGQSLDAEFCLGYGFTESSVSALNYLYEGARENSLLPFLKSDSFTIGNFLFRLEPGGYGLDLEFTEGVAAAGYVAEVRPHSVNSFLAILGVHFASQVIETVARPLPETEGLNELAPCSAPPLWINRRTGQTFTCLCFSYMARKAWRREATRVQAAESGGETEILMRPGLCSICSDHVPPPKAGNPMYYNAFLQRYLPYRQLFFMKMFDGMALNAERQKEGERIAENAARLAVGYPLIGQKWISETALFRTVRSLLAPRLVCQHYQGKELDGQEIDVWVPSLKLAIEYHGHQHFQALSVWGGQAALDAAKERDERKRKKLTELGYHLLEFQHDEQFTEETVLERIRPYLPKD
jgi:very-short-patch-repair endonuclease